MPKMITSIDTAAIATGGAAGESGVLVALPKMTTAEFDHIAHINDSPISGAPYRFWIHVRNLLLACYNYNRAGP
jgi:hypothetical protein